jgi:hypothetical protein
VFLSRWTTSGNLRAYGVEDPALRADAVVSVYDGYRDLCRTEQGLAGAPWALGRPRRGRPGDGVRQQSHLLLAQLTVVEVPLAGPWPGCVRSRSCGGGHGPGPRRERVLAEFTWASDGPAPCGVVGALWAEPVDVGPLGGRAHRCT